MEEIAEHWIGLYRDVFANVWLWIADIPTKYSGALVFFTVVFSLILGAECVGLIIWAIKRKFG